MNSGDILIDASILEEWLVYLREKTIELEQIIEESEQVFYSYMGLHQNVVENIFSIVDEFELDAEVKYLAIHLYDKYMNYRNWEAFKVAERSENPNTFWEKEQEKLNAVIKLRFLSCVQLASKMNSITNVLGILDVQQILEEIDPEQEYTKLEILESEFHIFKAVEFKMPQCTPKDCVDVLLAITGLGNIPEISEASERLLDLSYVCHEELYNYLKMIVEHKVSKEFLDQRSLMIMESNALFLGAAIIVCSVICANAREINLTKRELMKRFAHLVGIEDVEIWDMANLLFSLSVEKCVNPLT